MASYVDELYIPDPPPAQRSNPCIRYGRAFFALVSLAVSVIIAAPLVVIIVLLMTLGFEIYYAFLAAQEYNSNSFVALKYMNHALTNSADIATNTVNRIMLEDTLMFQNGTFWIALAGTPHPQAALQTAWKRFVIESTGNPEPIQRVANWFTGRSDSDVAHFDLNRIMRKRAEMKAHDEEKGTLRVAEADYNELLYTVHYVVSGFRTTYALQVITTYTVESLKNNSTSAVQELAQKIPKLSDVLPNFKDSLSSIRNNPRVQQLLQILQKYKTDVPKAAEVKKQIAETLGKLERMNAPHHLVDVEVKF